MREHSKRIVENIVVLLQKGQFPGEMAPAITEALQFLENMKKKITEEIEADGNSIRNSEDQAGLASSDLPDPGRKSRGRGKKRAGSQKSGS